ncbi:MoaF N-terminal domain-containing protein [Dasania marina]|uniref:MoaF N-terminal domain-containing protein n=1 Tax=Dasania marina TaxID=471499 RepID=UPI0030D7CF72|tara:strand:- start:11663 stop:12064 length:402 start_codon:yes stop_codon:yes gene_type:complete
MRSVKIVISCLFLSLISTAIVASELSQETRELNGTSITYNYTSGRSYNVKFEDIGISYRYLTGSKPDKWWGPFPYTAFEVDDKIFLASWFEEGYGDYVTLLINYNSKLLYGSAILEGKDVHFHGAKIIKINGK